MPGHEGAVIPPPTAGWGIPRSRLLRIGVLAPASTPAFLRAALLLPSPRRAHSQGRGKEMVEMNIGRVVRRVTKLPRPTPVKLPKPASVPAPAPVPVPVPAPDRKGGKR